MGGDYVTADSGTGLVHSAPGHGQEDYQVRRRIQNGSSAGQVVSPHSAMQEFSRVHLEAAMLRRCFGALQLGLQHGLEPFSPVDDAGCFTAEAGVEFQGLAVLDEGNAAVIQALERAGALLKVGSMLSG